MTITEKSIDLEKAALLISDYTLAGSPEDKDTFLSVAGNYIRRLDDPEIELIYNCVCETPDEKEKELYTEILIVLLDSRKSDSN